MNSSGLFEPVDFHAAWAAEEAEAKPTAVLVFEDEWGGVWFAHAELAAEAVFGGHDGLAEQVEAGFGGAFEMLDTVAFVEIDRLLV